MNISRIDQLLNETGTKIHDGYVEVIKGCLYGKPKQGCNAFEYSCIVASSQMFPFELREFARVVSKPTNEELKSTVSKMLTDKDFCVDLKAYFEQDECEYADLKSLLYPLSAAIERYHRKTK